MIPQVTQKTTPFSVDAKVDIRETEPALMPDSGYAERLKAAHPKYEHLNPYAFRGRMLTDSNYLNQYVEDVFGLAVQNPQIKANIEANPEMIPKMKNDLREKAYRNLSKDTYSGEDIRDVIVNRALELRPPQVTYNDVDMAVGIIKAFPENYAGFGLTDGKKANYANDAGTITALGQQIVSNKDLQKQIYNDKFNLFVGTLAKEHNVSAIDMNDPDEVAKAYAIFENYGPQGVTKYVNYMQGYIPGEAEESQPASVKEAMRFFNRKDAMGRTPKQVAEEFIGSPESEKGQLKYTPRVPSLDLTKPIPLDLSAFSAPFYQNKDNAYANLLSSTELGKNRQEFSKLSSDFKFQIDNDLMTDDYDGAFFDIMANARNGKGYTTQDLVSVIAANAKDVQMGEDSAARYLIDYNTLPDHAKIAVRALQMDVNGYAKSFVPVDRDGRYYFEPGRADRVQRAYRGFGFDITEERVPQYNEQGQIVGFNRQLDPGYFGSILMNIGRAGQFVGDYLLEPVIDITHKSLSMVGLDEFSAAIESSDFNQAIRDYTDYDPYRDVGGMFTLSGMGMFATDMAMYIGSAMTMGSALASLGGKGITAYSQFMSGAANMRNAHMTVVAGDLLPMSRFALAGQKIRKTMSLGMPHNTAMKIELGAAGIEALGGADRSIFGMQGIDNLTKMVGADTEIEKLYATSNGMVRFGLDAGASILAGFAFDNIWAGAKMGTGKVLGKQTRGLEFDETIKDYIKTAPQFAPDWRRFLYNNLNGLQDLPLGNMAESTANAFTGRAFMNNIEQIETLSDLNVILSQKMAPILGNLKDDIEKSVRYYDETLGGKIRYTDQELAERVDTLYDETLDKVADTIYSLYKNQNPDKIDLVQVMADGLEQIGPIIRNIEFNDGIVSKQAMSADEAMSLQIVNPNSVVVPLPDGQYSVSVVDPNFWGMNLAGKLRERALRPSVETVIDQNLVRRGIDETNMASRTKEVREITDRVHNVMNQKVIHNNERGYVTDVSFGKQRKTSVDSAVDETKINTRIQELEKQKLQELNTLNPGDKFDVYDEKGAITRSWTIDSVGENKYGVKFYRTYDASAKNNINVDKVNELLLVPDGSPLPKIRKSNQSDINNRYDELINKEREKLSGGPRSVDELAGDTYTIRTVEGNVYQNVKSFILDGIAQSGTLDKEIPVDTARAAFDRMATLAVDTAPQQPQRLLPAPEFAPSVVDDTESLELIRTHYKNILADTMEVNPSFPETLAKLRAYGVPESEIRGVLEDKFTERRAALELAMRRVETNKQYTDETRAAKRAELVQKFEHLEAERIDRMRQFEIALPEAELPRFDKTPSQSNTTTLAERWAIATKKKADMINGIRKSIVSGAPGARIAGETQSAIRQLYGIGRQMIDQITWFSADQELLTKADVRNMVMKMGTDNNLVDNMTKIAYNKGELRVWRRNGTEMSKGTVVVHNGQLFMARQAIKGEGRFVQPSTWMRTSDKLVHNKYWARVEMNQLFDQNTGELMMYKPVKRGAHGTIYERTDDLDGVFLNVQRPVMYDAKIKANGNNNYKIALDDIDGYIHAKDARGPKTIEIFNDVDQVLDPAVSSSFGDSMTKLINSFYKKC